MTRRIESHFIQGPAGRLESLLEEPEEGEPRECALVCHPHPQQGGTMHNKVVYRLARGLRKTRAAVLRFNFRGVNLSEGSFAGGEGELDDARAALVWLKARYPSLPLTLAGFSFGSRIALRLACERPDAARVIAAGFPQAYQAKLDLSHCKIPKIFVQSSHDQFGSLASLAAWVETLRPPKELLVVEASDHFFGGALDRFEEVVTRITPGRS